MKVNRRLFIAPDGRRIATHFDVDWCAVDKTGKVVLFFEMPLRYSHMWIACFSYTCITSYKCTHEFDWTTARFQLKNDGTWVRR